MDSSDAKIDMPLSAVPETEPAKRPKQMDAAAWHPPPAGGAAGRTGREGSPPASPSLATVALNPTGRAAERTGREGSPPVTPSSVPVT